MVKLFFDIETIPCEEDKKEEYIKILASKNGNGKLSHEELHKSMSLEGTFGRICCIGYIKEDGTVTKEVLCGSEKEILEKFWEIAKDVHLFVGHNAWDFDLPFIYKRSVILGVKPRMDISFARYRNQPIFDTMRVWELWNTDSKKNKSLATLAKVLGLPSSKDDMNGSMVWDAYKEGKIDDICRYCMKDVELTRQVYYKMTFEDIPTEQLQQIEEGLF